MYCADGIAVKRGAEPRLRDERLQARVDDAPTCPRVEHKLVIVTLDRDGNTQQITLFCYVEFRGDVVRFSH